MRVFLAVADKEPGGGQEIHAWDFHGGEGVRRREPGYGTSTRSEATSPARSMTSTRSEAKAKAKGRAKAKGKAKAGKIHA